MRPIDADRLKEAFSADLQHLQTIDVHTAEIFGWDIDECPTVDPVVHGRWERMVNPYGELEGFICECGHQDSCASNYCPSCGAKMDLEKKR